MAKKQTRRLSTAVVSEDRRAFDALQGITTYAPANPAYKTEAIKGVRDRMDDALREATQAEAAAAAKRAAANDAVWDFHNAMLGANTQVEAQFGNDSDEYAALGNKKKSEYKTPTRRRQSPQPAS
jgi:altronate dehydratase